MMVSTVRGHFSGLQGTAQFDPAKPCPGSVEATIPVGRVDTRELKRDAHLKSPDFFDAEKFPQMTFKSKVCAAAGAGHVRLTGDLTIRGVTKEVAFDVEGPTAPVKDPRGMRVGASVTAKINRKDFGVNWNRAMDAGGVVVADEVTITLDLELVQVNSTSQVNSTPR